MASVTTNGVLVVELVVVVVEVVVVVDDEEEDVIVIVDVLLLLLLLLLIVGAMLLECLVSLGESGVAATDVGIGCICDCAFFSFGAAFDTAIAFDVDGGTYDEAGITISSSSSSLSRSLM